MVFSSLQSLGVNPKNNVKNIYKFKNRKSYTQTVTGYKADQEVEKIDGLKFKRRRWIDYSTFI